VQALISAVRQFTYQVVAELPTASASTMNIIYLVPSADPQQQNVKDEFITIATTSGGTTSYSWEQIGSTAIDLSGYYTSAQTDAAITAALNTALANYYTSTQVDAAITTALGSYYTKTEADTLLAEKEAVANKATSLSGSSTDIQYPSAKAVFDSVALAGIYDVTAKNSGATFASLSALLSDVNINTLIPTAVRKGGMTIRFVNSSDNKYVSFRYLLSSTAVEDFTNTGNWINVDDEIATDGIEIQALAKLLVQQQYEIDGLKKMVEGNMGDIRATTINTDDMPMVSGKPMVIVENGAPTEVPYFVGQIHVNRSTSPSTIKVCYQVTGSISDWK
jgi:hypothetical protein